jgi:hypothetical protein
VTNDMTDELRARLPIDVHRLEFLPPGQTGGFNVDDLPPLDAPVLASHTITVPMETEHALQTEAATLGISVEELIVERIQRAA